MRLRKAEKRDWFMLLKWRNDKLTRKNSININPITEDEHKTWFFNTLKLNNRQIYIVEDGKNVVGTLRVDFQEGSKIISWTVAPEHRGKGYAKKMLKMLTDDLNGDFIAYIKPDNLASIKVAEYAGFKLFNKDHDLMIYKKTKNENK